MKRRGFIRIPWEYLEKILGLKENIKVVTIKVDIHAERLDIVLDGETMPEFCGALCSVPLSDVLYTLKE